MSPLWAAHGVRGAQAILAQLGTEEPLRVRRRWRGSPRAVRRALGRLPAAGPPAEQAVYWARFGRIAYGLTPQPFRETAKTAGVALGTAWNIEARIRQRLQELASRPPAEAPTQLSWVDPPPAQPQPEPSPGPPAEAGEAAAPEQQRLW